MAELDREKMLRKYRYFTNTTKSAKEKLLPVKDLPCIICNKPITERDVDNDNCEANINNGTWVFFHKSCYSNKG